MAAAMGSNTVLLPSSSFSSPLKNTSKFLSVPTTILSPRIASTPHLYHTLVRAQLPTWLLGLDPPSYLDETLPGDFGFDPLGLGEDSESLRCYVQVELVHARFAMAGVAGILFTDV